MAFVLTVPVQAAGKKNKAAEPGKTEEIPFGEPYLLGSIGAKGLVKKDHIIITEIEAGSPAEAGKLAVGDKIVGIKVPGIGTALFRDLSQTESPFTLFTSALTRAASGPKEKCRLTMLVERGGKTDDYTVKPERSKKHAKGCPKSCKQCDVVIREALDWLAARQMDDEKKPKSLTAWTVEESVRGLAFIADGKTTPQGGPYTKSLIDCIKIVVEGVQFAIESSAASNREDADPEEGGGKMENWALGLGGLFLTELYAKFGADAINVGGVKYRNASGGWGTPPQGALVDLLAKIAKRLAANQETSGGWSHGGQVGSPNNLKYIEFMAVSNWCLAALGRMSESGIPVPPGTLKKAIAYAQGCSHNGGVAYAAGAKYAGTGQIGRTGGTLFAFWCGGLTKEPLFLEMERYVEKTIDKMPDGHASPTMHFLACGLGASRDGFDAPVWKEFWDNYIPKMESLRKADGSFALWPSDVGNDPKWGGLIPESQLPLAWPTAAHALLMQLPQGEIFEPLRKKKKR